MSLQKHFYCAFSVVSCPNSEIKLQENVDIVAGINFEKITYWFLLNFHETKRLQMVVYTKLDLQKIEMVDLSLPTALLLTKLRIHQNWGHFIKMKFE